MDPVKPVEQGLAAPVALIGPPGAGCRSVGRALTQAQGGAGCADLSALTAAALGVAAEHALVAVAEEDYRRAEAATAVELLEGAGDGRVLALGSGWVGSQAVRRALEDFRAGGGRVVALIAQGRALATRNGLGAPRSVALGPVHHRFIKMLGQREEACRALAGLVVDTTSTTAAQAAARIREHLARA